MRQLRRISKKRAKALREEAKVREQLLERCQGLCEECGQPPNWLGMAMHEKVFRSHGGKPSLENSVMLCDTCNKAAHGIRVVQERE